MRCFGDPKDTIDSKQLKNQIYPHESSTFKKKRTRNGHFPRPRETEPYVHTLGLHAQKSQKMFYPHLTVLIIDHVDMSAHTL